MRAKHRLRNFKARVESSAPRHRIYVHLRLFQVAMQRAKVCVRSVTVSGENHLRLVKVKELQQEIADHEAAYLDNTGMI